MAEKKVHGGVELGIHCDDHNHTHIPHYGDCINGQEDQEEGHLEVWLFREVQENEGDSNTLISLFHHYGSCRRKSESPS